MLGRLFLNRRWSSGLTLAGLTGRHRAIILAGPPGSGKTTVARIVASRLGRRLVDMDDDVLEPSWQASVADQLATLGDTAFLAAEARTTCEFQVPDNSVVALTGSNPLDPTAMEHLSKFGIVVFLDVAADAIASRLRTMKVDRIVGQKENASIASILAHRQPYYDSCYDIRLLVSARDTPERIADLVVEACSKQESFVSTRGGVPLGSMTFTDVIQQGLASDRGLYVPEQCLSPWTLSQWSRLVPLDFRERLQRVMEFFPLGRMHPSNLKKEIDVAYNSFEAVNGDVLPLRHLTNSIYVQETYHGPTASFKDLALQLTPRLMATASARFPLNRQTPRENVLLVATSGDTGVAAMDGFARVSIPVVVLYPSKGVSRIQRHQMLTAKFASADTRAVAVDGDFDFCQSATKDIFEDASFDRRAFQLTAGNSMNWGRLLPQVAYGANSYLDLVQRGTVPMGSPVDVVVPTGNFGHILGMIVAKHVLGLPLGRIICASNINDVLVAFVKTGVYDVRHRRLQRTQSPSVDILLSSNVERFLHYLSDGDSDFIRYCYESLASNGCFELTPAMTVRMRHDVSAMCCSEDDCLRTIRETHRDTAVLVDPHTALGVHAAQQMKDDSTPIVVSSTAHFAKFPAAIFAALELGSADAMSVQEILATLESIETLTPMHFALRQAMDLGEVADKYTVPADSSSVRQEVVNFLREQRQARTAFASNEVANDTDRSS
ncbi:Threonine synthase [Plasmodiophora brassicae]